MDEKLQFVLIDVDPNARTALESYIAGHAAYRDFCRVHQSSDIDADMKDPYIVIGERAPHVSSPVQHFLRPVRIGAIGDALNRLIKKHKQS